MPPKVAPETPTKPAPTAAQSLYKYKINSLLLHRYGLRRAQGREDLLKWMDISRQTLSADANILLSSRDEIPRVRLIAYAKFFNLNHENELINE